MPRRNYTVDSVLPRLLSILCYRAVILAPEPLLSSSGLDEIDRGIWKRSIARIVRRSHAGMVKTLDKTFGVHHAG